MKPEGHSKPKDPRPQTRGRSSAMGENPTITLHRILTTCAGHMRNGLIMVLASAFVVACPLPRDRDPDPPPADKQFLMDSVPRGNSDQILVSQADADGSGTDADPAKQTVFIPPTIPEPPTVPPVPPDPDLVVGDPPEDADHEEPGREMEAVEFAPPIRSREERRDEVPAEFDWRVLHFSSGAFRPQAPGLDPAMAEAIPMLAQAKREEIYGFLLMEDYLAEQHREALARLGVRTLGPHGNAHKIAIPVDEEADVAQRVAELDFVHWVGFSPPELKRHLNLDRLFQERNELAAERVPPLVPMYLNLFDIDPGGQFLSEILVALKQTGAPGAAAGHFDRDLLAYRVLIPWDEVDALSALDFVLFMDPVLEMALDPPETRRKHDESTPTIGGDYIRPMYNGAPVVFGIMDTGFMVGSAAPATHQDLNKWGLGHNFTEDGTSVWNDGQGHGTHVLGTVAGTGAANSRYRGMAPGVGSSSNQRIRAAQVFRLVPGVGWRTNAAIANDAMEWLGGQGAHVINYSGGESEAMTRKQDAMVWAHRQLYVVSAGNAGPGAQTISSPGKNALTVGNIRDFDFGGVGQIWTSSSRGPTSDGRMKPNVVAPGRWVRSATAGTTGGYNNSSGTSMAAPHVAGLASTMMHHYPVFQYRPMLTRARLMATSILHDDDVSLAQRNSYGMGRVSSYKAHWRRDNANGWKGHWSWGNVHSNNYLHRDFTVPSGAQRLVVVMTWDEPPASAGASQQRLWDLELWLQHNPGSLPSNPWTNVPPSNRRAWSWVDNSLYLIVDNPAAGTWRMMAVPYDAPHPFWSGYTLPTGMAATVIRGDTTPNMSLTASASTTIPAVGDTFEITTTVSSPSYITSGVHLRNTVLPAGIQLVDVRTTRADGVEMSFGNNREFTLGNVVQGNPRTVIWTFRAATIGCRDIRFRAWSENGGTRNTSATVCAFPSFAPRFPIPFPWPFPLPRI